MANLLSSLRRRAWPTRRAFDARLDAVQARLDAMGAQIAELASSIENLDAQQQQLTAWEAETRTRVRRTQALTARVYEGLREWPALLADARAAPDYELPYTEREPLISIPIPTFRSADTLCERALASVLAQTHSKWEAIVVGDHCTDDTEERVAAMGDPRIRFFNLPVREADPDDPFERWAVKGSVPRSTGIEMARGRWIAPLSHDDAWDPDHLETLLDAARESRAEVVYSQQRVVAAARPGAPRLRTLGEYPPRMSEFGWQSAMFHGALRFLQYDRACALASEPNDWNLARRAWEAGVKFHMVDRETVTLFYYDTHDRMAAELGERGLPPSAAAVGL
jgi:hypothetical protein